MLLACLLAAITSWALAGSTTTQPVASDFDRAYSAIRVRMDPRVPSSVARSIEAYQELADRFPHDPHVWKATLALANIYSFDPRPEGLRKADTIFSQLKYMADPSNADGRLICDRILAFDIFNSDKWHPQKLLRDQDLADRYESWALRQEARPSLLHIWAIKGAILLDTGPSRAAISYLLNSLKTAEQWGLQGYYLKIATSDNAQYQAVIMARQELLISLSNAVGGSQDSDVDVQVGKAALVGDYPTLRGALRRWRELRNPIPSGEGSGEENAGDPNRSIPTTTFAPRDN
jgi:hypothetical protein